MKTTSTRARALACALLATTAYCGLTAAPAAAQGSAPPAYRNLDPNGVDLTLGDYVLTFLEGSIGSGEGELALLRLRGSGNGPSQWDGLTFQRNTASNGTVTITIGRGIKWERFSGTGGSYTSAQANGATLTGGGSQYQYRAADGTTVNFGDPTELDSGGGATNFCTDTTPANTNCSLVPLSISEPNGKTVTLSWQLHSIASGTNFPQDYHHYFRLSRIANSFAYRVDFSYIDNNLPANSQPTSNWFNRSGASFFNDQAGSAALAQVSYAYPAQDVIEVTDTAGRVWRFGPGTVRRPGSQSDDIVVTSGPNGVTSVVADGVTTNYSRTVSGSTATMTVTNGLNQQSTVVSDLTIGRPTSMTDPLNRTTSFQYDANGRLTRTTAPEGNYVQLTLDPRGNVTQAQAVPKPNSGAAPITTSASYDSTCYNPATCNSPNSVTDARGNITEFTYDFNHGGLLAVTAPAVNGVRPQTRYGYALTNGEYQLTSVAACQTQSSCAGTADEVKTSLGYDANGNVTSMVTGNGNGSLTATQAMTYDAKGDLLTVDGPLSGTADTTRLRYNGGRELVGTISPDPDGGGALKHRATRNVIDGRGLVTKVERGTVNSQSDADWNAFAALEAVETGYDANRRPVTSRLVSGSTTYALTQTSYDALGRPECSAQRMNPAAFGTLPASACTLGSEGSFGPDRIVKSVFNAAGETTQVRTAVGTALEEAEASSTYTANGKVQTLTDGENNKTTYEYDGHDRLSKTLYPVATKGAATSNASDYEQYGYDAAGNRTSFRSRAGEIIVFTFDALNRMTYKDLPESEPEAAYTYDLLGRLKSAASSLTFTYDALGRKLTETGPHGTVTSQYDIGGRRTKLTYPDGFVADYTYLVTGEMKEIRQQTLLLFGTPPPPLATFGYDDLGRRTSITRANGATTSYSYDPVSRLSQLSHDPAGTANDLTLGFSYNPASQITSNTRSNDVYAWTGHGNGTLSSPANGLNQLTSHNGGAVTHDAKGNVTYDPTTGYTHGYSSENLLRNVSGSGWAGTLTYDPLMRLYDAGAGGRTRFVYDGEDRIAEYSSNGSQVARFVHGPGIDEPLIEYTGSGLGTRRFTHADERGSIIAVSDDAGNVTKVGRFDEQGRIQSFASYRFGYAGQPYETLTELYYSRARMYNPTLPRFMQPDPIGYGSGMNLYAYVKGDPVNLVDPSGLDPQQEEVQDIIVNGRRLKQPAASGGGGTGRRGNGGGGFAGGGGGSYGGGGATGGGWGDNPASAPADPSDAPIVVTARRPAVTRQAVMPRSASANRIYFGYPPEPNSAWHITRHLTKLSPAERRLLRAKVGRQVREQYPTLPRGKYATGFVTFREREYQWRAFGLPNGITNIGTIFDVTE